MRTPRNIPPLVRALLLFSCIGFGKTAAQQPRRPWHGHFTELDAWPGSLDGIQFLWEDSNSPNEAPLGDAGELQQFTGRLCGRAWFGPNYELLLAEGAFLPENANQQLLAACRQSNQLTVEAAFSSDGLDQHGPARILSFSSDTGSRDFTLGQEGDRLVFRLRTPRTGRNGTHPQLDLATIEAGRLYHVLVTCRPDTLCAYVDGREVFTSDTGLGDFSNWEPQRLIAGDEHGGGRNWAGRLEGIAVYSRFVDRNEAERHFRLHRERVAERRNPGAVIADARLLETVRTPTPDSISPYRRCLVEYTYERHRVHRGELDADRFLVAHWVIMDGTVLPVRREVGTTYRLDLEPWADHPQLAAERRVTCEGDDFELPLFVDVCIDPQPVADAHPWRRPNQAARTAPETEIPRQARGRPVPEDLPWLRSLCEDGALAYCADDRVHLVELADGETRVVGTGWQYALEFSPDSSRLAWIDGDTAKGMCRRGDQTVHTIISGARREAGIHWDGNDAVLVVLQEDGGRGAWHRVSLTGRREPVPELDRLGTGGRETDVKRGADGVWSYVARRTWKTEDGHSGPIGGGCSCSLSPDARSITALQGDHKQCRLNAIRQGGFSGVLDWHYAGTFDNHRWSSNDPRFLVCMEEHEKIPVVIHRETGRATRMGQAHSRNQEMYGDFTVGDGRGPPWPRRNPAPHARGAPHPIRRFSGTRTRLVWTRTDDPNDFCANGSRCHLMGLDSDDGRGEREILPERAGYAKPILTPDGRQVLYSDRAEGAFYVVGFDGRNRRRLGTGYASDAWRDPRTDRVWVYYRSGAGRTGDAVRRCRLDEPSVDEPVWDRTPTGHELVPWFRLSADGSCAADAFPWSACGIADLREGSWERRGSGCWPSVAPDDSRRYFHFLGSHKEIRLYGTNAGNPRTVRLDTIPGLEGQAVYHPRWSHHPRFLTVTAPKKSPRTELYLGRFSTDFSQVEAWIRVSHNDRADTYGDAWLAP